MRKTHILKNFEKSATGTFSWPVVHIRMHYKCQNILLPMHIVQEILCENNCRRSLSHCAIISMAWVPFANFVHFLVYKLVSSITLSHYCDVLQVIDDPEEDDLYLGKPCLTLCSSVYPFLITCFLAVVLFCMHVIYCKSRDEKHCCPFTNCSNPAGDEAFRIV